ncbi:MAG: GNAT family N-acetyltransferase [Nitriliruptorales bacterium]|nr:GNAT family N-acetyltransferase [Nitriliruptorales bacterium]
MANVPLRIRRLVEPDHAAVQRVFGGLSATSRYRRFHAPIHRLSERLLDYLATPGPDHLILVAEVLTSDGWEPVGLARAVRTTASEAELAIEVVDDWQGRGIGRRLVDRITVLAGAAGMTNVVGEILPDNEPMLALWAQSFPRSRTVSVGRSRTLRAALDAGPWRPDGQTVSVRRRPPSEPTRSPRNAKTSLSTTQGGEG